MRRLSFDEIQNWEKFEDLVASYFRHQESDISNNVFQVDVRLSGKGSDGGKDLLVKFQVNDSVQPFIRTWVIQCKFYDRDLKKSDLSDVNIPSLIHQYNADGYLLVCKRGIVNTLATMFEDLNQNCRFGYSYVCWTGEEFIEKLYLAHDLVRQQFFPEYFYNTEEKKGISE